LKGKELNRGGSGSSEQAVGGLRNQTVLDGSSTEVRVLFKQHREQKSEAWCQGGNTIFVR